MRPPICAICDTDFDPSEGGDTVHFEKEEDAEESPPGHVGHPPHVEWFCEKHVPRAQELTHLTRSEALEQF